MRIQKYNYLDIMKGYSLEEIRSGILKIKNPNYVNDLNLIKLLDKYQPKELPINEPAVYDPSYQDCFFGLKLEENFNDE